MLSVANARAILGPSSAGRSDSDVASLIEQLHVVSLVIGGLYKSGVRSLGVPAEALLPEERESFEERAAILEFDGKLSRARAERLALGDPLQSDQPKPCAPLSTAGSQRASRRRT